MMCCQTCTQENKNSINKTDKYENVLYNNVNLIIRELRSLSYLSSAINITVIFFLYFITFKMFSVEV